MRPVLRLGPDRAIVLLRCGAYLCVDLRSIDALPFVFEIDVEPDVIAVFRTFLRPESVVVDVGANFGLYTAIAGRQLAGRGRLFAFEGNPGVFQCLVRTIAANRLWPDPRISFNNLLVSDRSGRGTIYFTTDALGGGTMSDVPPVGEARQSADVAMTSLDDFLPDDVAADLVKIDVEGHEPLVLRGMERTVERSPNLRLIVEFSEELLRPTTGAAAFADEIRARGFHICRILPHGGLELLPPAQSVVGYNNCLLTRTPERDIAAVEQRRRDPWRRLRRWVRQGPKWAARYGNRWPIDAIATVER